MAKSNEAERAAKLIVILGFNGTGKTTFLKKLIHNELKKPDSHILIVTPDDIEWTMFPEVHPRFPWRVADYVKARKLIYEDGCLNTISENFRNGLLVFDDCRAYLTAQTDKELHNLLIRRRQKGIDIIAVGHGFTEVPPKFFTFMSELVLFKTIDNIDRRKDVLNNFELMKEAQRRINQHAQTNPHYFEILKVQ